MSQAKRILSLLLCVLLCLSLFPAAAVFAEDAAAPETPEEQNGVMAENAEIGEAAEGGEVIETTYELPENDTLSETISEPRYTSNVSDEALGLANPYYSFSGVNGEALSTAAENGRPKLVFYYQTSCGNCSSMLSDLANGNFAGVDIIAAELNGLSSGDVAEYMSPYTADNIYAACDSSGVIASSMWSAVHLVGIGSSVSTPVCLFIDKNNVLQMVSFGYLSEYEMSSNISRYCGAEASAPEGGGDDPAVTGGVTCSPTSMTLVIPEEPVGEIHYTLPPSQSCAYSVRCSHGGGVTSVEFGARGVIRVTALRPGHDTITITGLDPDTGAELGSAICRVEVVASGTHVHTFSSAWSSDSDYHWHAATCEHTDEISGKAAHSYGQGKVVIPAKVGSTGLKTYTCQVCGAVKDETLPALPSSGDTPAGIGYMLLEQDTGYYHFMQATGRYTNWAGVSTVSQFTDENGNFAFAVFNKGHSVRIYKTQNGLVTKEIEIPCPSDTCGSVLCDSKGYIYIIWGRNNDTSDTSVNTIFVTKYTPDGTAVATVGGNGSEGLEYYYGSGFYTKYPFDAGNCDAAINGNILMVNYARELYSGHQANTVFAVNIDTMEKLTGFSNYNSHSFDQRVTPYQNGFLLESHGDCFPRTFSTALLDSRTSVNELDTFHFWVEKDSYRDYDMYRLNRTYARLGNILSTSCGAALVAASARSLSADAKTEPYDLFVQVFDPSARTADASAFVTTGTRTGLAGKDGDEPTTDHGVQWLTNLAGTGKTIDEVQAVSINANTIAVLYELYANGRFDSTWFMLLNGDGSVLKAPECLGDMRLNTCEDPVYAQGAVQWIANVGNSNVLRLYSLFISDGGEYFGDPYSWGSLSSQSSFVSRMYEVCLGRSAEPNEIEYYIWLLNTQGFTGVQVANAFIFSDEFTAKNYCDRHFVIALYKAFMGREPQEHEIENWVWRLQQGDRREDVFNKFATSKEFGEICAESGIICGGEIEIDGSGTRQGGYCTVADCTCDKSIVRFAERLYTVCLDRSASDEEIAAWHYNLVHGDYTATSAADFFLFSPEFERRGYDNAQFAEHLYRAMMGREADPDEIDYWVWEFSENGMTRRTAFEKFAASDEFYVICQAHNVNHG